MDGRKLPVSGKLILASASARRAKLLREAGIAFERKIPHVKETKRGRPSFVVSENALRKAGQVAVNYPGRPVLGSDTVVYANGEILGKPSGARESKRMLRRQNGKWMRVYSSAALVWKAKNFRLALYDVSRCKAKLMPERDLKRLAGKHADKAGSYAVQDKADSFIEKIRGRHDTIVGMPLNLVKKLMRKANA